MWSLILFEVMSLGWTFSLPFRKRLLVLRMRRVVAQLCFLLPPQSAQLQSLLLLEIEIVYPVVQAILQRKILCSVTTVVVTALVVEGVDLVSLEDLGLIHMPMMLVQLIHITLLQVFF